MKVQLPVGAVSLSDRTVMIAAGVLVLIIGGTIWYVGRKAKNAAIAAGDYLANDAINVTSSKNVFNTVANSTLQATGVLGTNRLTGKSNTIGSATYYAVEKIKGFF